MKKYNITVNGTTYEVLVEEAGEVASAPAPAFVAPVTVAAPSVAPAPVAAAAPAAPKATGAQGANSVTAPMPGTILDVKVSVGQSVKKGDVVCVLEAMKMENDIPAPCDGVIASVNVQKGASVNTHDLIASIN
jgi:glutaconyl-CoA decarboxylase